jgi:hypothetical protein
VEYLASGSISLTSPTTVTQPATLLTSVSTAQQVPASDVVANVRLKLSVAIAASPSQAEQYLDAQQFDLVVLSPRLASG